MPLCGSSGSISPISIFVRIIRARRENSSSTLSPERAETSTETGTEASEAQREATSEVTSRPSGATVTVFCVPNPPLDEFNEPQAALLLTLEGVGIGSSKIDGSGSYWASESSRSVLFPARITVSCGEAKARASLRKVGRALKDANEAIS